MPSLLNNLMLFYTYDVHETDTPENIAYKYYNDIYSYWIVLYSNGIIDPYSSWPLDNDPFNLYLIDKYSAAANGASNVVPYTTSTVYGYFKTVTTFDTTTSDSQTITIQIDENTYNNTLPSTQTAVLNGIKITKITNTYIQSLYDYEIAQNEAKRNNKILNKNYLPQVQIQFKNLMSS